MRNVRGLWSLRPGSVTELRPDCFEFGKWRDTVHTVCTLSNKWGGGEQLHGISPPSASTPSFHEDWKHALLYLRYSSVSQPGCVSEKQTPGQETSQSFLHPPTPTPPTLSNGGPLYWTVKSQPLSARAYMYGSGSVHVLLHTRGHVQTAVLCFARISQTFQPALIGPDRRAHIAVQMQQGKKRKDLG